MVCSIGGFACLGLAFLACGGLSSGASCKDQGTCPAPINGNWKETSGDALTVAVMADDAVRVHLSNFRPSHTRSEQIRSTSTISEIGLVPIIGTGIVALIMLTFDNEVTWFGADFDATRDGSKWPLKSMGKLHPSLKAVSSLAASVGNAVAIGHQDGNATILHPISGNGRIVDKGMYGWEIRATVSSSHHGWERVTLLAVSRDGVIVLVCTDDNVALWRIPSAVDGNTDEFAPRELRHLHGGAHQVSAAFVANLEDGGYITAVGFTSGAFEGWDALSDADASPLDDSVEVLWRLPRRGLPRLISVTVGRLGVVGADADGEVHLWSLDQESFEISENQAAQT